MSVTSLKEALENRNKKCPTCNEKHDGKCKRGDLVFRIENLVRANALIPQLMNANKEAVEVADGLQQMAKRFDEAHTILMEILKSHGEKGAQIEKEYLGRLDTQWASEPIKQDTSEQLQLFSPEPLTLPERPISDSTKQQSGLDLGKDSSNTTQNVIAAENAPQ